MLGFATVAITGALVFYTIGVFAERQSGTLKLSHIVLFYLGLTCDTTGTACSLLLHKTALSIRYMRRPEHLQLSL